MLKGSEHGAEIASSANFGGAISGFTRTNTNFSGAVLAEFQIGPIKKWGCFVFWAKIAR